MSYLRSIPLGPSPLWDMVLALFLDAGNRNLHTFFTTFHWQPPQLCPSVSTAQGHLLWGPSQVIQAQPPSAAPMLPMGTFMQPSLAHRCKCSWSQGCLLSNTWHEKAPKKPPSTRIPRVESVKPAPPQCTFAPNSIQNYFNLSSGNNSVEPLSPSNPENFPHCSKMWKSSLVKSCLPISPRSPLAVLFPCSSPVMDKGAKFHSAFHS